MRRLLGRSPKEEIHRVQIERAQQLLAGTSLPAGVVSARAGFSEPKYFNQVFRTRWGLLQANIAGGREFPQPE